MSVSRLTADVGGQPRVHVGIGGHLDDRPEWPLLAARLRTHPRRNLLKIFSRARMRAAQRHKKRSLPAGIR